MSSDNRSHNRIKTAKAGEKRRNCSKRSGNVVSARYLSVMADDRDALPDPLLEALAEIVDELTKYEVQYALIGGLAAGVRGRSRFTDDIDFLLTVPQLQLP